MALSETQVPVRSAASHHPLAPLHDPGTIRARSLAIARSVEAGVSPSFTLDRSRLPAVAERVAALTLRRFPDLVIPFHSRWRHFEAGGVNRKAELDAALAGLSVADRARAHFDLAVVSVLLDAGAGAEWRYTERTAQSTAQSTTPAASALRPSDEPAALLAALDSAAGPASPVSAGPAGPAVARAEGSVYARSEGLGVASLRAFMAGSFSAHAGQPCRADAAALRHVDVAALRAVFQSSPSNPMVGLEGRAALLARLGQALQAEATGEGLQARPGLIYDRLTAGGTREVVAAGEVLGELLRCFAPIWPSGSKVRGLPAGDVWPHRWAGAAVGKATAAGDRTTEGWVPFHKLSQWMAYSLLEPLQWAGVTVTGLDALTGLPEYRNGGLLLDAGVIVPRHPQLLARRWKPGDEFIIEWRALTVTLLDELAVLVRERLGRSAAELPLACILEGGTWAAGREIAAERRPGGAPPLLIDSDGTVF